MYFKQKSYTCIIYLCLCQKQNKKQIYYNDFCLLMYVFVLFFIIVDLYIKWAMKKLNYKSNFIIITENRG